MAHLSCTLHPEFILPFITFASPCFSAHSYGYYWCYWGVKTVFLFPPNFIVVRLSVLVQTQRDHLSSSRCITLF
ncbi:hypothetical protein BDR03DRAFT_959111 [Suillus americanus]|nr:hypothetical protein BDR03DRAFT_959111 [Suillus americanus]